MIGGKSVIDNRVIRTTKSSNFQGTRGSKPCNVKGSQCCKQIKTTNQFTSKT